MNREKALQKIAEIMRKNNLSCNEVINFVNTQNINLPEFDLLCLVSNKLVRLPFAEGKNYNPQGLYPFKNDNRYIRVMESGMIYRRFADENLLLREDFCKQIYPLRKQINKALSLLNKPLLQGCYFAVGKTLSDQNWIVSFDDNPTNRLASDYYDDVPAKARYFGVL